MQVLDPADETTEQVTAADQVRETHLQRTLTLQASINAFARANRRANEIDDLLKEKKARAPALICL